MNSIEYIIGEIDKLVEKFPFVKLSYQIDQYTDTHFVEVLPKDLFEKYEDDFTSAQNKIVLDFINEFPEEGLAFITINDLFKIDQPIYVKIGTKYSNCNSVALLDNNVNELFKTHKPDLPSSFSVEQPLNAIAKASAIVNYNFNYHSTTENHNYHGLNHNLNPIDINSEEDYSTLKNHPLAA